MTVGDPFRIDGDSLKTEEHDRNLGKLTSIKVIQCFYRVKLTGEWYSIASKVNYAEEKSYLIWNW